MQNDLENSMQHRLQKGDHTALTEAFTLHRERLWE
jgi:hypothetical protein